MKVKLSTRNTNQGDKAPFVLEIYKGHSKSKEGKIKHKRTFRTLDYYLYKTPRTPQQKQHNKEHKKLAEAVRSKTELELVNGTYGLRSSFKGDVNVIEYFAKLRDEREGSQNNRDNWHGALKYLTQYCPDHYTFKEVDVEFVEGFKKYLDESATTSAGKGLAQNTKHSYFNKFRACLNHAYTEGLLAENPVKRVKAFRMAEPQREYLTIEEVKALSVAECRYEVLKKAFLFACLTGLRWSDVQKLTWKAIRVKGEIWEVSFIQQKTKGVEYLPISGEARKLLGEEGEGNDRVFPGLKYSSYSNVALQRWVLNAGITKEITFHCARHTYAVIHLMNGGDIYTLSKLLGHRELKTTEIYAKIVDEMKVKAIKSFPKIGL